MQSFSPEQQQRLAEAWEGRLSPDQLSPDERKILADKWEEVSAAKRAPQSSATQYAPEQIEQFRQIDAGGMANPVSQALDQNTGGLSTKAGLAGKFSQGLSFGFSDEITGGMAAGLEAVLDRDPNVSPGDEYRRVTDRMRTDLAQAQTDAPVASTALEIGGGLATGGGAAARMGAAKSGAMFGGAYGFGSAEGGAGERLDDLAFGAATGAAAGKVGEKALQGLGSVWQALMPKDKKMNTAAARIIRDRMSKDFGEEKAKKMFAYWVRKGGDAEELIKMQGEEGLDLLRTVATFEPRTAVATIDKLRGQQAGKVGDAITDSMTNGRRMPVSEVRKIISDAQEAKAKPLYEAAYRYTVKLGSPQGQQIAALVADNPAGVNKAVKLAMAEGDRDVAKSLRMLSAGKTDRISLKALDYFKRGMDDQIGAAQRAGSKQMARALTQRKNAMLEQLDQTIPEYGQARAVWSGGESFKDALDAGKNILAKNQSADEFAQQLAGMSDSELMAARIGVAERLETLVKGRRDGTNSASFLDNPLVREKLQVLFRDSPDEAASLIKIVGELDDEFRRLSAIDPRVGSMTQPRLRGEQRFRQEAIGPLRERAAKVAEGPFKALSSAIRGIDETGQERKISNVAEKLGRILFGDGASGMQATERLNLRKDALTTFGTTPFAYPIISE